jgi:hypothetical protein
MRRLRGRVVVRRYLTGRFVVRGVGGEEVEREVCGKDVECG